MISKKLVGLLILGVAGVGAIVFGTRVTAVSAPASTSKAEKLAELLGRPVEEVISEKYNSNKTYGTIAEEAGVLEQFQEQNVNCDGTGNGVQRSIHHDPTHHYQSSNGRGYRHSRHH